MCCSKCTCEFKSETIFQDGDIAEFNGDRGVVKIKTKASNYPVILIVNKDTNYNFTLDGRWFVTHTKPLLVLIERPKKKRKVKKTIERWINIYPFDRRRGTYPNETEANLYADSSRITCVKLTGEYEVEEES